MTARALGRAVATALLLFVAYMVLFVGVSHAAPAASPQAQPIVALAPAPPRASVIDPGGGGSRQCNFGDSMSLYVGYGWWGLFLCGQDYQWHYVGNYYRP